MKKKLLNNWRDSLIDPKKLKWKQVNYKYTEDGKYDLNINIPLSELIEIQAKQSYAFGINKALQFFVNKRGKLTLEGLADFLTAQGYPEIAAKLAEVRP